MNAATGRKQNERGIVGMNILSNSNIDKFGYVIWCITQKRFSKGRAKVTKADFVSTFEIVAKSVVALRL
jgi:hypothetical protein